MKNIFDKQRKYSLRKSKAYGLTLAVIGILYFGGGNALASDVVTNADNTTVSVTSPSSDIKASDKSDTVTNTLDTTTVSNINTSIVSETDNNAKSISEDISSKTDEKSTRVNADSSQAINSSTKENVEDTATDLLDVKGSISDVNNLIESLSVNATDNTATVSRELDASKVNVSYDSVNKRIDISLSNDLVVSEGDTITFATNNIDGDIISKSSPKINNVPVADISYKTDDSDFNRRRDEFLKKLYSSEWKTITKEEIVNAYNDLLNHEWSGAYTVTLKESLNGLVDRHIYIPINTNVDGSIGASSYSGGLFLGDKIKVPSSLYNSLPNKEGISKIPYLKYNGKDIASINPYKYSVEVPVHVRFDTTDGATITRAGDGLSYDMSNYDSNYGRFQSDRIEGFYSSPKYKVPLENSQYFKPGDIKITLGSDTGNIGSYYHFSNSHINAVAGHLWNMDAPLPKTITFKKHLTNNNKELLETSNDGSLISDSTKEKMSESGGKDGQADKTIDIIYNVEKLGDSIVLTNANEFILPEGSDSLIYEFKTSDFVEESDVFENDKRFRNNESPFLINDEFPGSNIFDEMTIIRDYFEEYGTLKGTPGNYYREYSYRARTGNNHDLTESTSARIDLKIRHVEEPDDFAPVTLLATVNYTLAINSDVDNSALGNPTGTVNVHYVDTLGNKIQEPKSLGTKTFDTEYSVKPEEEAITGWNYLNISSNSSPLNGTYGSRVEDVILVYERVKSNVIANYYKDGTTDKLAESDDQGKKSVDSDYTTVSKTILPKVEIINSPEREQ